jgi:hypothetical protein
MTTDTDDPDHTSLLSAAGIGGAVACCLALELLGGAAVLGGLAAAIGLSTGLIYVAVIGVGGVFAALFASGYHANWWRTDDYVN